QIAYFPAGTAFTSQVPGKDALNWASTHAFTGLMVSSELPQDGVAIDWRTLIVIRGVNDGGLALSHQAYGDTGETPASSDTSPSVIPSVTATTRVRICPTLCRFWRRCIQRTVTASVPRFV
ncbi:MAG: hypothetical protein ACO3UM_17790, partial [Planctomycetota bacterium]